MLRLRQICSVLAFAVLAVLPLAAPASPSGAGAVPWSAEIVYVQVGREPPAYIWVGEGKATLMGPVTAEARDLTTGPRHRGTTTIQDASGNAVFASYQVDQVGPGEWAGTFTVIGGSGRFDGASGGGALTISLVEPGVVLNNFEGTLNF